MKLGDALESDVSIRLSCKSCGANQLAFINQMVDKHGLEIEFEQAMKLERCIFCDTRGDFTVFIIKIES